MNEEEYKALIEREFQRCYQVAVEARRRIGSPTPMVEILLAKDLAERVELLVGPKGVAEKIRKYFGKISQEKLAFRLAEELVSELRGRISDEELALQAIRTCLAVLTPPCITAAPTEGIVDVKIKRNPDGSKHLSVYFAGPIRSAGGTELASIILIADHVRKLLGLDKYKPTDEEIMRFIEELRTYQRRVSRFQYNVPEDLIEFILRRLPVEVTGIATDRIQASSFKGLSRIETDHIRGGALRVVNDGIAGRAKKVLKLVEELGLEGWDWIKYVAERMKELTSDEDEQSYLDELVGGRPLLSSSKTFGGLRIRYGRSFSTGMQAVGLHPLTLKLLMGYLTTGTQLKLDYPGKGGIISPVDSIEPPIVMLDDGSVLKLRSEEDLKSVEDKISRILFLGDILISIGDLIENNAEIRKPGYCEEWWAEELRERLDGAPPRLRELASWILEDPIRRKPSAEDAIRLSIALKIPLHPEYLPFWRNASIGDLEALRSWMKSNARDLVMDGGCAVLPWDEAAKQALTRILVEHIVSDRLIKIPLSWFKVLVACLRPFSDEKLEGEDSIQAVERISGILQRDKAGSFIGARMGRPEKAAQREMSPPVNVLFPISDAGGSTRDIIAAAKNGRKVSVELSTRRCPECGEVTWREKCPQCGEFTEIIGACVECGLEVEYGEGTRCPRCGGRIKFSRKFMVNIGEELYYVLRRLSEQAPTRLKGVKGLNSVAKTPELLEKGVLRAKYGLYIYKDGTIRFDATNAPLTHFTPRQISTPVEKLRELGYTHDIYGEELVSPDQILELKPQDVVISRRAAEHLLKVSKFIDELLVKVAGMEPFYVFESIEDVVGALIAALSPHTYAGVVGRVIGFTDSLVCFAHPIFHAAKRRDCDGDEDSIMLLLDPLINFSRLYLPGRIGGKMDAPLLLTVIIDPKEVDEQAHNLDVLSRIPLEFYRLAERGGHISELAKAIPTIKMLLSEGKPLRIGFTHPQSSLVAHPIESSYKRYGSMLEKIMGQLKLAEKVDAVDECMVVEKMVETHLLSDILGNMRAFLLQEFKCKRCGEKYRRPPLAGVCMSCGGEVSQTVFRGAVEKYVDLVENLLLKKIRDCYLAERVVLAIENVRRIFGAEDRMGQPSLEEFLD